MQGLESFFKVPGVPVPVAVGFFRDLFDANDFLHHHLMLHTIGH